MEPSIAPPEESISQCKICLGTISEAYMTKCGHSFCHRCIRSQLDYRLECPICKQPVGVEEIYPNFSLNKLITESQAPSTTASPSKLIDPSALSLQGITDLMTSLVDRRAKIVQNSKEVALALTRDFLKRTIVVKEQELKRLQQQIGCLTDDLSYVESQSSELSKRLHGAAPTTATAQPATPARVPTNVPESDAAATSSSTRPSDAHERTKKRKIEETEEPPSKEIDKQTAVSLPASIERMAEKQGMKVQYHFEDLQEYYFGHRNEPPPGSQPAATDLTTRVDRFVDSFANTLNSFSRVSRFRLLYLLNYADSSITTTSIVSSIEFDKDDEFFATAGVTKKLKIYDYEDVIKTYTYQRRDNFITRPYSVSAPYLDLDVMDGLPRHREVAIPTEPTYISRRDDIEYIPKYPIRDIGCKSKISCLSWNSYFKSSLAASDYDGVITIWDTATGQSVHSLDEHEKRAWTVDFSSMDPLRIASGGDDTRVKIWSMNERSSVLTLEAKANVCSVKFNPGASHEIAFGSADHHVHYYDLRKSDRALHIFRGHRKAVSYVKYLNKNELVSASTDCTLRMWNIRDSVNSGASKCIRTFSGHLNEKNFVGLSINSTGEFISCGSEANCVYTYFHSLPKPVIVHKFGNSIDSISGEEVPEEDPNQFVSSVCWKRNSPDILLSANSRGIIKVMEMT
ncbi:WD40-repeat-containing domain protein [Polychytrium aggregatum]|uniref:WD40-repeat-containing domain protein n=1 Tax=Polychytrium aggregatum TaxID=110093 RepID=UPI0022FEF7A4|nr:WD40-repeat-containing domain protein [Polychytrium aggregatum]KAI9205927.1 WD40-repeat-containing domain protein [Polychytrium aggregatum]